ncbi:MAG: DNA gyrase modulator, partial [Pseudomonadota bacterium]
MQDLLDRAMNLAQTRGAQYADARVIENETETLVLQNGEMRTLESSKNIGVGVRVLVEGAWGFASSRDLSLGEVDRVTDRAFEIARASALVPGGKVDLGPAAISQGTYKTPVEIDPFSVSLDQKVSVLMETDQLLATVPEIKARTLNLVFIKERKWFANSDGARTDQTIIETGGGMTAHAVGEGEVQQRSYPSSWGRQQVTAGWETVVGWDLPGNAERIA